MWGFSYSWNFSFSLSRACQIAKFLREEIASYSIAICTVATFEWDAAVFRSVSGGLPRWIQGLRATRSIRRTDNENPWDLRIVCEESGTTARQCGDCVEITSNLPVSSSAEQTLFFVNFANLITIGYHYRGRASAFISVLFELPGNVCFLNNSFSFFSSINVYYNKDKILQHIIIKIYKI